MQDADSRGCNRVPLRFEELSQNFELIFLLLGGIFLDVIYWPIGHLCCYVMIYIPRFFL